MYAATIVLLGAVLVALSGMADWRPSWLSPEYGLSRLVYVEGGSAPRDVPERLVAALKELDDGPLRRVPYVPPKVGVLAEGQRFSLRAQLVHANYFAALGVPLWHGRAFEETDRLGAPVVIVHPRLAERLGLSATEIIGRVLKVGDVDCTVIGVVRPEFTGVPEAEPAELWLLFTHYESDGIPVGMFMATKSMALRHPLDDAGLAAEVEALNIGLREAGLIGPTQGLALQTPLLPMAPGAQEAHLQRLRAVQAFAWLLLLFLATARLTARVRSIEARRHDHAIRLSLGVPDRALLAPSLGAELLLALAAIGAAVLAAPWLVAQWYALQGWPMAPPRAGLVLIGMLWPILLLAPLLALPWIALLRQRSLRSVVARDPDAKPLRWLLGGQLGLLLAALVLGAVLATGSWQRMRATLGHSAEGLHAIHFGMVPGGSGVAMIHAQAQQQVESLFAARIPLPRDQWAFVKNLPGDRDSPDPIRIARSTDAPRVPAQLSLADPEALDWLGLRWLARTGEPGLWIPARLARDWYGGAQAALGQDLVVEMFQGVPSTLKIEGVVADTAWGDGRQLPTLWLPMERRGAARFHLLLRDVDRAQAEAVAESLRGVLSQVYPDGDVLEVATVRERLAGLYVEQRRLGLALLFGLALLGVVAVASLASYWRALLLARQADLALAVALGANLRQRAWQLLGFIARPLQIAGLIGITLLAGLLNLPALKVLLPSDPPVLVMLGLLAALAAVLAAAAIGMVWRLDGGRLAQALRS
ncbi:MAG: ABC transporter permease [Xanthomonadales bacterium]|nr:ABC transporter permease [Xanthomonadales bacterium]